MAVGKRKRTHKVSRGEHGGGGKVKLIESQRTAAIGGGVLARFKPIGSYLYQVKRGR